MEQIYDCVLDCTCVYLVGDWNADMDGSSFGEHLSNFIDDANLEFSSKLLLPNDTFTFLSEAWSTTSWLDHCISTSDGHSSIEYIEVDYEGAISDHFPVNISITVNEIPAITECKNDNIKLHNTSERMNIFLHELTKN